VGAAVDWPNLRIKLVVAGDLTCQQRAVVGLIVGLLTSGLVWTVRRRREQKLWVQ
jgi:hypothetical protein